MGNPQSIQRRRRQWHPSHMRFPARTFSKYSNRHSAKRRGVTSKPMAEQGETTQAETWLSVVVPLFNEAEHLNSTLPIIMQQLETLPCQYELLLVDDGSIDGTWGKITQLSSQHEQVLGIRLSRNFGKEGAVSAGLRHAHGHAVVVMDGDLQHPPSLLPEMYRIWKEGNADVVEAVKITRGDASLFRKIGGRLFNASYSRLTGYDLSDATDFKLMDRRVVDEFLRLGETRIFYRGMIAWLGFRHKSVGFEVPPSARLESAWSTRGLSKYALTALTSFTSAPLHIVTLAGFFTLAFSVLLAAQTLFFWASGNALAGFSTVIVVQLFGNSIVMLSLGVIGEYLGSIYQESKRRPRYVISDTAGIGHGGDPAKP